MGFSRQEYWSGLPFPPPGALPDPEIEPASPVSLALACGFVITKSLGKPFISVKEAHFFKHMLIKTQLGKQQYCYQHYGLRNLLFFYFYFLFFYGDAFFIWNISDI